MCGFLNPDVGNFRFHTVNIHVVPSQVVTGETWRKVKTRQQRPIKCHFGERRQVLRRGMKHNSDLLYDCNMLHVHLHFNIIHIRGWAG